MGWFASRKHNSSKPVKRRIKVNKSRRPKPSESELSDFVEATYDDMTTTVTDVTKKSNHLYELAQLLWSDDYDKVGARDCNSAFAEHSLYLWSMSSVSALKTSL